MELSSKLLRMTGVLCVAGTLQGVPSILASVPNTIPSIAQQNDTYTLTGTVLDQNGIPVIGANVIEKGTTNGTVTDFDGNFSIQVNKNSVLTVIFIGYVSQEVAVKGGNKLNITLKEDSQALDEVVVVGYGTRRK